MIEPLTVIIPAAGAGKRMGMGCNKAFVSVAGVPVLAQCLKMLAETELVSRAVILVLV